MRQRGASVLIAGSDATVQPPPSALTRRTLASEPPREDRDGGALIRERRVLRGDHLEIAGDAAAIPVGGERQRSLGRRHRGRLDVGFLAEHAQRGEAVLDLLQRLQDGLLVEGDRLVVARARLRRHGAPAPAVGQRRHGRGAGRPERAQSAQPAQKRAALEPRRRGQEQPRKERRLRDAHFRAGRGDAPLGGGDVGTAFEQIRRQAHRNVGRRGRERRRGQLQRRRRLAGQDGDGVLERRAPRAEIDGLRARRLELRLGQRHVGLRRRRRRRTGCGSDRAPAGTRRPSRRGSRARRPVRAARNSRAPARRAATAAPLPRRRRWPAALARADATPSRTRPQTSASYETSTGSRKSVTRSCWVALVRLPDWVPVVICGAVVTCGYRDARAIPTAARAWRNRACAPRSVSFDTSIVASSPLSCGSPKISHHAPRFSSSAGCPAFQSADSLNAGGTCGAGGGSGGVRRWRSRLRDQRASSECEPHRSQSQSPIAIRESAICNLQSSMITAAASSADRAARP